MSDENTKNQDSNPDENPENKNSGAGATVTESFDAEEEDLLLEIENLLNEEDPDFLNQLTKIEIDQDVVDLTILDNVLSADFKGNMNLLAIIRQPFDFRSNLKQVLTFWSLLTLIIAVGVFVWNYKGSLFHQNLFLTSFAEIGSDLEEFNPLSDMEPFYDNIHFAKNLITISPMHVNLRPSINSGLNPMLAIEVTAEGLSSDAIIEIKDREAEFKDMLLRHTEEKTYDELVEAEGKQRLCEQYRDIINTSLTQGQIRRVNLKSFIIKP